MAEDHGADKTSGPGGKPRAHFKCLILWLNPLCVCVCVFFSHWASEHTHGENIPAGKQKKSCLQCATGRLDDFRLHCIHRRSTPPARPAPPVCSAKAQGSDMPHSRIQISVQHAHVHTAKRLGSCVQLLYEDYWSGSDKMIERAAGLRPQDCDLVWRSVVKQTASALLLLRSLTDWYSWLRMTSLKLSHHI